MSERPSEDEAVRRERAVMIGALGAIALLTWIYLWQGAGMGMSALDMTAVSLFPHLQPDMVGEMESDWGIVVTMWWVMMIAMMTPSAAPLVLLYGRMARHQAAGASRAYVDPLFLLSGYLLAWLAFAIAATALQKALEPAGLISSMMLWSKSAPLSASVLAAAGLYQLSPLKHACLNHCRAPLTFLMMHWRPGRLGALIMGARHGAFCVGCCWMLMALLFVGGVMNLVWIAVLTVFVLVEKLSPAGPLIGKASGALLLIWAAGTLLV